MTLVLTLHFNVWRILEVSAKYRSRFFMILGVGGPTSVKALLQGAFNIEKALVGAFAEYCN